ncbi:MAG: hypothetical protein PGN12_01845 [Sphingomonas phyllosphaerae]
MIVRWLAVAFSEKAKQIVTGTSDNGVKRIIGSFPSSYNTLPSMRELARLESDHQTS